MTSDERARETTLHALFDKRLSLFNTRRGHEWQVLFGVITLIGAVDVAIITQAKSICPYHYELLWKWQLILISLTLSCFIYQLGIQLRNLVDRLAMDEINWPLCDAIHLEPLSLIRLPMDRGTAKMLNQGKIERWWGYRLRSH